MSDETILHEDAVRAVIDDELAQNAPSVPQSASYAGVMITVGGDPITRLDLDLAMWTTGPGLNLIDEVTLEAGTPVGTSFNIPSALQDLLTAAGPAEFGLFTVTRVRDAAGDLVASPEAWSVGDWHVENDGYFYFINTTADTDDFTVLQSIHGDHGLQCNGFTAVTGGTYRVNWQAWTP